MTTKVFNTGKRILIVDDDDDFRDALEAALSPVGYRIQHATNGLEALRVLRQNPRGPCAMLIDLMMPEMDGWQLIDVMTHDPDLARIPSAVISAARDEGILPNDMKKFSKPCNLPDLLLFLRGACPEHGPHTPPPS